MRKLSTASIAIIIGIAFYFALAWGYDGVRVLMSPSYGLEDVWRSQFVFAIGGVFGLSPIGLIKLAAFFGAVKLAVAVVCGVHVLYRLRALTGRKPDSEMLEGGLILVVLVSIVSVGPAVWTHNAELVRESTIQLALAAIATALCLFDRSSASPETSRSVVTAELAATPRGAPWFSPFR